MILRSLACWLTVTIPLAALGHEGHDHAAPDNSTEAVVAKSAGVTGSGDLKFRYHAQLSSLPPEIAQGIEKAHGGFCKMPGGEIYFGLNGTGLVHLSADLQKKTIVSDAEFLREGGMHNTAHVDLQGGLLVLPDNEHGKVHVVRLDGSEVATLDRPRVNDYYNNPENSYAPTDAQFASNGLLYVCDGYSKGKYMLTVDIDRMDYTSLYFGGSIPDSSRVPGRFGTNHGLTFDPTDNTLMVADRGRHWIQKLTLEGDFVSGIDMDQAMVCDVDYVDWQGERLLVAGCLRDQGAGPGVVHLVRGDQIVSTLRPKEDLGLEPFQHIHNAVGVVVQEKLYILCYGWNPGCYAVLEHVGE